ncbi:gamma-aminobutyric acid receptor subunit pi-like [Convolutriloba macropyga]|uniref:gamma-aminobutyric acid receptor subunit pi-like n=1 Tax=Convolutriloba macropyga TaxID=536237 RepID=UPI003F5272A4
MRGFSHLFVTVVVYIVYSAKSQSIKNRSAALYREQAMAEELKRQEKMRETTKVLVSLLKDYDSRLRPNFGGDAVQVNVTMNVDSLGPISETEMSFRVDISFRQMWYDERLEFETEDNAPITLSHEFLQRIWVPDTYFPESLSASKHKVMGPNILLRLSHTGFVLYSSRVTVVTKCPMDLEMFPLDTQVCSLMVECFGYTTNHLRLRWLREPGQNPVTVSAEKKLPQFTLIGVMDSEYDLEFTTGTFSDLEVNFKLQRTLLYYVLQTYAPAVLIVGLSWVGFWVDPKCIPARASLSITTVLTIITLMGTVNSRLPKVSKVKALDVYFGLCFIYVFGALIEFACVCYFDKHFKTKNSQKAEQEKAKSQELERERRNQHIIRTIDSWTPRDSRYGMDRESRRSFLVANDPNNSQQNDTTNNDDTNKPKRRLTRSISKQLDTKFVAFFRGEKNVNILHVDNYSRVLFPATFLIFNILYWGYYYRAE